MGKMGAGGGKIIILKWICYPDSIFILIQIITLAESNIKLIIK